MSTTPIFFKCCGGIWFFNVPFVGVTRFDAGAIIVGVVVASLVLLVGLLKFCLVFLQWSVKSPARAGIEATFIVGAISVALGPLGVGVRVAEMTSSLEQSVREVVTQHVKGVVQPRQRRKGFQDLEAAVSVLGSENVTRWLVPRSIPNLLSSIEAQAIAHTILHQRAQHLIHLDAQAGPLPFMTYGSYWGYLQYDPAHRAADPSMKGKHSKVRADDDGDDGGDVEKGGRGSGGRGDGALPPRRQCTPGAPVTSDCLSYNEAVKLHRTRLLDDFPFLYDRLCDQLSAHLGGQPVKLLPGNASAPPGFQIWLPHRVWSLPVSELLSSL